MTLDENLDVIHGQGMVGERPGPSETNGGADLSDGVPRSGIPAIQMADAAWHQRERRLRRCMRLFLAQQASHRIA